MSDNKEPARRRRARRDEPAPPPAEAIAPASEVPAGPAAAEELPLSGNLDRVRPDGTVIAWCWSPAEPDLRRPVSLWIDGGEVARAVCDRPRRDLVESGVGDGGHALEFQLPPEFVHSGETALVSLYDVATGRPIGADIEVTWGEAPPAALPRTMVGHLDRVSRDGRLSGWCWYPGHADEHVSLTVLVDGRAVGSVEAADPRADLRKAGIGDGDHGFVFVLPPALLAAVGKITIEVRETATGAPLGEPMTMRTARTSETDERILDLERQLRLLRSELEAMARRDRAREQEQAARSLFATMAGFFRALADGDEGVLARADLAGAVADITTRFAPLALAVAEAPAATVCVPASAPATVLYACLAALHAARADERADIVLLDDGALGGEAALLPAVVRNLRYQRVPAHASALTARNAVAAAGRGEFAVWLAPQVAVRAGWLDAIVASFEHAPAVAAVTSKVVRGDGLLHHTGILLGADGLLGDPGRLAAAGEHDEPREMDGCGDVAFAVRRDRLASVGGFAAGFTSPAHAAFDLCMRLRAAGGKVLYQPAAVADWTADGALDRGPVPDLALPDEDARRLALQWGGGGVIPG